MVAFSSQSAANSHQHMLKAVGCWLLYDGQLHQIDRHTESRRSALAIFLGGLHGDFVISGVKRRQVKSELRLAGAQIGNLARGSEGVAAFDLRAGYLRASSPVIQAILDWANCTLTSEKATIFAGPPFGQ